MADLKLQPFLFTPRPNIHCLNETAHVSSSSVNFVIGLPRYLLLWLSYAILDTFLHIYSKHGKIIMSISVAAFEGPVDIGCA